MTIHVSPNTTCLANDSFFALVNGEGVFPGSICEVASGVQLRFSVTDIVGSTHYSQWTDPITVSGTYTRVDKNTKYIIVATQ